MNKLAPLPYTIAIIGLVIALVSGLSSDVFRLFSRDAPEGTVMCLSGISISIAGFLWGMIRDRLWWFTEDQETLDEFWKKKQ